MSSEEANNPRESEEGTKEHLCLEEVEKAETPKPEKVHCHCIYIRANNDRTQVVDANGNPIRPVRVCKTRSRNVCVTNVGNKGIRFTIAAGFSADAFDSGAGVTQSVWLPPKKTVTLTIKKKIGGLQDTNCGTQFSSGPGDPEYYVKFQAMPSISGSPGDPEMVIEC